VAVQFSGTFGSRQEEAQRLGRLLRPKGRRRGAIFYSVVSATHGRGSTPRTGSLPRRAGLWHVIKDADDCWARRYEVRRVMRSSRCDLEASVMRMWRCWGLREVMNHG